MMLFIMYYQINNSLRPDVDNRFLNTYWSGFIYHCAVSDSAQIDGFFVITKLCLTLFNSYIGPTIDKDKMKRKIVS